MMKKNLVDNLVGLSLSFHPAWNVNWNRFLWLGISSLRSWHVGIIFFFFLASGVFIGGFLHSWDFYCIFHYSIHFALEGSPIQVLTNYFSFFNMSDSERIALVALYKRAIVSESFSISLKKDDISSTLMIWSNRSQKNIFFICFWQFFPVFCPRANRSHRSSLRHSSLTNI